jgi:hypothetical protein
LTPLYIPYYDLNKAVMKAQSENQRKKGQRDEKELGKFSRELVDCVGAPRRWLWVSILHLDARWPAAACRQRRQAAGRDRQSPGTQEI